MSARSPWVELGRIGAPFGLAGWVHVASYTDPPEALLGYRQWRLSGAAREAHSVHVSQGRRHGDGVVARLEGIEDRDAAAALTGALIEVERSALPPTAARQHYRADLIGLEVRNLEGRSLGTVAYFVDAPSGPVMVVNDARGGTDAADGHRVAREHWVLADPTHLLEVDRTAGQVLVDWPAELD